jgi:hypothetical protein
MLREKVSVAESFERKGKVDGLKEVKNRQMVVVTSLCRVGINSML